jgi:hypothetical protein
MAMDNLMPVGIEVGDRGLRRRRSAAEPGQ